MGKNWQGERAIIRKVERRYSGAHRCVVDLLDRWSEDDWRREGDPVAEGRYNEKKSRVEYRWPPASKRNPHPAFADAARAGAAFDELRAKRPHAFRVPANRGQWIVLVHKNTSGKGWQATTFDETETPINDSRSATWVGLLDTIRRDPINWTRAQRMNPVSSVGLDWQWAKMERQGLRDKDRKTRQTRDAALKGTSAGCVFKRKEVTAFCNKRKKEIRDAARKKIDKTKRRRAEVNKQHGTQAPTEASKTAKARMSKSESDSLAEHNIEPALLGLWRETKHLFPYDVEPDMRAELFAEWMHEHQNERTAWMEANAEATDYGAEEAEYYRQQQAS